MPKTRCVRRRLGLPQTRSRIAAPRMSPLLRPKRHRGAARHARSRKKPSASRRLSALYPERALERGREGEARLHCIVQAGGTLDCERLSETPGGFGPAALRVARTLRHAPRLEDGSDAEGTPVRLRVVFRMAEE